MVAPTDNLKIQISALNHAFSNVYYVMYSLTKLSVSDAKQSFQIKVFEMNLQMKVFEMNLTSLNFHFYSVPDIHKTLFISRNL